MNAIFVRGRIFKLQFDSAGVIYKHLHLIQASIAAVEWEWKYLWLPFTLHFQQRYLNSYFHSRKQNTLTNDGNSDSIAYIYDGSLSAHRETNFKSQIFNNNDSKNHRKLKLWHKRSSAVVGRPSADSREKHFSQEILLPFSSMGKMGERKRAKTKPVRCSEVGERRIDKKNNGRRVRNNFCSI